MKSKASKVISFLLFLFAITDSFFVRTDEVLKLDANSVRDGGLTVDGFVALHQLFIQKGRLETVWAVLRKFGYSDDLSLEETFVAPPVDAAPDEAAELSREGRAFFDGLFTRFADVLEENEGDGAVRLSLSGLQRMFATTPGLPWGEVFEVTIFYFLFFHNLFLNKRVCS